MNSTQKKRLGLIAGGLIICGAAAALVFNAFEENLVFFFSPSQVAAHEAPEGRAFRIGGFVQEGSVQRQKDGVTVRFDVTDTAHTVPVTYKGRPGPICLKKAKAWSLRENCKTVFLSLTKS